MNGPSHIAARTSDWGHIIALCTSWVSSPQNITRSECSFDSKIHFRSDRGSLITGILVKLVIESAKKRLSGWFGEYSMVSRRPTPPKRGLCFPDEFPFAVQTGLVLHTGKVISVKFTITTSNLAEICFETDKLLWKLGNQRVDWSRRENFSLNWKGEVPGFLYTGNYSTPSDAVRLKL